jgi:ABC-2 type transport system permease protein
LNLLSGGNTPLESMPPFRAPSAQASPSTYFASFAQEILIAAPASMVWPQSAAVGANRWPVPGLGLLRFRSAAAQAS